MTIPHPRKPEPLPDNYLNQRNVQESKWERNDRAGEAKLRDIQAWAKEQLADIFIAQRLGGNHSDPDFMRRVDETYDTIRNALTRQDLILGFLINVQDEAQKVANKRLEAFNRELRDITEEF